MHGVLQVVLIYNLINNIYIVVETQTVHNVMEQNRGLCKVSLHQLVIVILVIVMMELMNSVCPSNAIMLAKAAMGINIKLY